MMQVSGISSPEKAADNGSPESKPSLPKAVHIIDELMNTEEEYGACNLQ